MMKNKIILPFKKNKMQLMAILAAAGLYSCVPTKTLRQENTAVPARYQNHLADSLNTANIHWKDFFSDPQLNALIDTALLKNQELNIMLQQVDMAKNEIKARRGVPAFC
jgi:outer membrane protein TolC